MKSDAVKNNVGPQSIFFVYFEEYGYCTSSYLFCGNEFGTLARTVTVGLNFCSQVRIVEAGVSIAYQDSYLHTKEDQGIRAGSKQREGEEHRTSGHNCRWIAVRTKLRLKEQCGATRAFQSSCT